MSSSPKLELFPGAAARRDKTAPAPPPTSGRLPDGPSCAPMDGRPSLRRGVVGQEPSTLTRLEAQEFSAGSLGSGLTAGPQVPIHRRSTSTNPRPADGGVATDRLARRQRSPSRRLADIRPVAVGHTGHGARPGGCLPPRSQMREHQPGAGQRPSPRSTPASRVPSNQPSITVAAAVEGRRFSPRSRRRKWTSAQSSSSSASRVAGDNVVKFERVAEPLGGRVVWDRGVQDAEAGDGARPMLRIPGVRLGDSTVCRRDHRNNRRTTGFCAPLRRVALLAADDPDCHEGRGSRIRFVPVALRRARMRAASR